MKFIRDLIEHIKGLFGKADPLYRIFDNVINGKKDYGYKTRVGQALGKTIKNQKITEEESQAIKSYL